MTEFERQLDLLLGDALTELERLQRRKWVGLTEEEIAEIDNQSWKGNNSVSHAIKLTEEKLKEKNT